MTSVFSFVSNDKTVLPIVAYLSSKFVLKSEIAKARGRESASSHDPLKLPTSVCLRWHQNFQKTELSYLLHVAVFCLWTVCVSLTQSVRFLCVCKPFKIVK